MAKRRPPLHDIRTLVVGPAIGFVFNVALAVVKHIFHLS